MLMTGPAITVFEGEIEVPDAITMNFTHNNNAAMNPITEDDIANYLANTPDFFERHAQLLAQVQLTSPHGNRAVSLQERQAEMLREKIKALEHRVMDMVRHGTENVVTADRLQRWTTGLLTTRDPRGLPPQIAVDLQSLFLVPQIGHQGVGLRLRSTGNEPYAQWVSDDVKALATSLTTPYCGLNAGLGSRRLAGRCRRRRCRSR